MLMRQLRKARQIRQIARDGNDETAVVDDARIHVPPYRQTLDAEITNLVRRRFRFHPRSKHRAGMAAHTRIERIHFAIDEHHLMVAARQRQGLP